LWALGSDTSVHFIFSASRPKEVSTGLWVAPVSEVRVLPSGFNVSSYLHDDPDPHVMEFVSQLSGDRIKTIVEHLASYNSRNSYSPDTPRAADWVKTFMASNGCQNIQTLPFRNGFAPNIVCEIPGTNPNAAPVMIGAHYDSRSTNVNSPTQRAPGADDNGSGSAAVLEILTTANYLIQNEQFSFESTLIFALFSGEEQGLIGSAAMAQSYSNSGMDLTAMINLDMIGFPDRAFPTTLYWMARATTGPLTELAIQLTKKYLGEQTLISTTNGCCSDQQSFYNYGYPVVGIFEARTPTNNPNYHQSSDLPATLNYQHALRNTQAASAVVTTVAKISGPL